MNQLPDRPLINNATLPVSLPNVPSFEQMVHNGRPRKVVPEVGKDFPVLNGAPILAATNGASGSGPQIPLIDREHRVSPTPSVIVNQPLPSQPASSLQVFPSQQQQTPAQLQTVLVPGIQLQQSNTDDKETPLDGQEPQLQTAFFRPDNDWREQLQGRAEKFGTQAQLSGSSAWEGGIRDNDDYVKEEETELSDEETTSSVSEADSKIWRPRRTLRKSVASR